MPVIMIFNYVIPYQIGTGTLGLDGSIDWSRGEAILAFTWAALYIPLGLISARLIWLRYSPAAKVKSRVARRNPQQQGSAPYG